jgi:hypothetical protein
VTCDDGFINPLILATELCFTVIFKNYQGKVENHPNANNNNNSILTLKNNYYTPPHKTPLTKINKHVFL